MRGHTAKVVSATVALVMLASVPAATAQDHSPSSSNAHQWQLPVSAPIVRGFEAPVTPYGPGHRGVSFDTLPGTAVAAAADGSVSFAGAVARTTWVSVRHDDGIVTSYGPLDVVSVSEGDRVARGDSLGVVASRLHWGARRLGGYVDPMSLLGIRPSLVGEGHWRAIDHAVEPYAPWQGSRFGGLALHPSPAAEMPGYVVAPTPNHAVVINGLATDSQELAIDVSHLGYDAASITALSYAGRDGVGVESLDDADPWRDQQPYSPDDTWYGVHRAAEHLDKQLRAIRAREPGRAVDLIGHSMGGVVAAYYLTTMHDPYDVAVPPIGNVVTVASPHRGSALAELGLWARNNVVVRAAVGALFRAVRIDGVAQQDRTPLSMPALEQLATGQPFIERLGVAWEQHVDDPSAGAFAMGTQVLTVAGAADLVATPGNTAHPTTRQRAAVPVDDSIATHAVLPGGHHSVTGTQALREVMWEFMSGGGTDAPSTVATARLSDEVGVVIRLLSWISRTSPLSQPTYR